jgi:putative tricarboxylic transport membrane protein
VTRPVSLTLLILAGIAFAIAVLPTVRRRREAVFEEEV